MYRALILVTLMAALAGACGKKQAPMAPKAPAADSKDESGKATEGAPDKDMAPAKRGSDPCEGGENK